MGSFPSLVVDPLDGIGVLDAAFLLKLPVGLLGNGGGALGLVLLFPTLGATRSPGFLVT